MTATPTTAMGMLSSALSATAEEYRWFESGIGRDEYDALHQARTRVRTMRSVLAAYGCVFDADAGHGWRRALARLGGSLGAARDAEVREDALRGLRESVPDPEAKAALADLVAQSEALSRTAREHLLELIGSPAHTELLRRLGAFAAAPPPGPRAERPIAYLASRALRHEVEGLRPLARRAASGELEDLHTLRKAARRLRYAAEAVDDVVPWAADVAEAAERLQDALGDHRDAVLLADELRGWALTAGRERGEHGKASQPVLRLSERLRDDAAAELGDVRRMVRRIRRAVPAEPR